jgi:hypothetical protein
MRMFMKGTERRSSKRETPLAETIVWIRRHAPLADLCMFGGWPDDSQLRVEVCSREPHQWIVTISFVETIMEISECDVTEHERCGQYAVSFDKAGHPVDIRLVQPL